MLDVPFWDPLKRDVDCKSPIYSHWELKIASLDLSVGVEDTKVSFFTAERKLEYLRPQTELEHIHPMGSSACPNICLTPLQITCGSAYSLSQGECVDHIMIRITYTWSALLVAFQHTEYAFIIIFGQADLCYRTARWRNIKTHKNPKWGQVGWCCHK